jgi:hypothetical protein
MGTHGERVVRYLAHRSYLMAHLCRCVQYIGSLWEAAHTRQLPLCAAPFGFSGAESDASRLISILFTFVLCGDQLQIDFIH